MRDLDYSDVVRDARRMIEQGEAPADWPAAPASTEITPTDLARSLLESMDYARRTGTVRDGGRYASFLVQLDGGQAFRITVEEIDS